MLAHLRKRQALLQLRDGPCRVETLGACPTAVENGVAAVQAHAVVQCRLALLLV